MERSVKDAENITQRVCKKVLPVIEILAKDEECDTI
jgi:hypothetical protein